MPVANRPGQEARRSKTDGARAPPPSVPVARAPKDGSRPFYSQLFYSQLFYSQLAKGRVEALAENVDEELLLGADSATRGGGGTQLQTTSSRRAFAMPSPTPASSPPSAEKKRT